MASNGPTRTASVLIATIAIFVVLYFASVVFAPVACALFIIAIVWPLQDRLQTRLPRLMAVAIVTFAFASVVVVLSSLAAWGFGRLGRALVNDAARVQLLYEQASIWLDGHGVTIAGIWTDHFNMPWLLRTAQVLAGRVKTTLSFWLIVLIYVILGLLEIRAFNAGLRRIENPQVLKIVLDGSLIAAEKIRRYMLVRTVMSLLTGALVWLAASLAGLNLAVELGVIAFVLNYIPFVGPFIATLLPTLFALIQIGSWQTAVLLFIGLNIVQFAVGSYIEPRVAGGALSMPPVVVLFSVFLWTFMWGLFGAFIGVPITIAIVTLCAQHPASRWLADLLRTDNPRER